MKTLRFATNIKCGGCIAAVTPYLQSHTGILSWEVDLSHPQRVLTVETDLREDQVAQLVQQAGYTAEKIQ